MLNRSASLAMSTCVLKVLSGKLDNKRHSPSILYFKYAGWSAPLLFTDTEDGLSCVEAHINNQLTLSFLATTFVINSFFSSSYFCCLPITFANSLNVGPDRDLNTLTL